MLKEVNFKQTSQRERAKSNQVKNNAGGFVFKVNDKQRLERFLILGVDGGTFYASSRELTNQNVDFLRNMITRNEEEVINTIVDVSTNGRAPKNSPALFALAMVFALGKNKIAAKAALLKVARTSTHLFEFVQYLDNLGGWGRAKREAVAEWYTSKTPESLVYQVTKYRQRNGWTHRDVMRLSHPRGLNQDIANFVLRGDEGSELLSAYSAASHAQNAREAKRIIDNANVSWEMFDTGLHKDPEFWKALFYAGKLNGQALVRNVTRLARIDAFSDMQFAADYATKLKDVDMINKTRLHPINFLNAYVVYTTGQVDRNVMKYDVVRKKDWTVNPKISSALNDAFYLAFGAITPANKRTLVALDISGSMHWQSTVGTDLTAAQAGAALAMQMVKTEPVSAVMGFSHNFVDLQISPEMSLTSIINKAAGVLMGRTDCALPMVHALNNKIEVDTFVIITDNETWFGRIHPYQALKKYRDSMGIPAKLAVFGMTATDFSIADPSDSGSMDFVGFDASAPNILTEFSAGRL